jgi:hypothetical protein
VLALEPAGQGSHEVAPGSDENVPGAQTLQILASGMFM